MKTQKRIIGDIGEELTCKYLEKQDYKIIARNYSSKYGELDIVACKDKVITFVEVKTRHQNPKVRPCLDVTKSKQIKIMKTAYLFMKENKLCSYCRFDISEVYLKYNSNELHHINYIKRAFIMEDYYESF